VEDNRGCICVIWKHLALGLMLDAESQLKISLCNYGEDFSLSNWEIKLSSPFLTVQSGKGSTTVALHV
jgi:hypothetical protein